MERDGIACQPHTASHQIVARLTDEDLESEIRGSIETLREKLGRSTHAFAYPNGTRADYDERALRLLATHGVTVAFTSEGGPSSMKWARSNPRAISRIPLDYRHDTLDLAIRLAGASRLGPGLRGFRTRTGRALLRRQA